MADLITSIVSSVTLSGILCGAIVWLSRTWITERLKNAIKNEYDEKLESHKAKLKAEHDIAIERLRTDNIRNMAVQTTAATSLLEGHKAAHERRLAAAEELWKAVLQIGSSTPGAVVMIDVCLEQEYQKLMTRPSFKECLRGITMSTITERFIETTSGVESVRPFLGEYLYSLFFAYRALNGRLAYLLSKAKETGTLTAWYKDNSIRELLVLLLTTEELQRFDQLQFAKVNWMRKIVEQKIALHINKIISGELSADFALDKSFEMIQKAFSVLREMGS